MNLNRKQALRQVCAMAPFLSSYFYVIAYKSINTTSTTGPRTTRSLFDLCSVCTQVLFKSLMIHRQPVNTEILLTEPHSNLKLRSTYNPRI